MMALLYQVKVFLLMMLFFPRSECKGIGKTSTTLPPPETTTTARPYPGCGVKLDREYNKGIVGSVARGTVAEENAYPWMAFLYNFDRNAYGIDVMELDLPPQCRPKINTTTTTPIDPSQATEVDTQTGSPSFCGGSVINPRYI